MILGLYLDTSIRIIVIGKKHGNMFSILNELTQQKELQPFKANTVFCTKKYTNNNNKTDNQTIKALPELGNERGTSRTLYLWATHV